TLEDEGKIALWEDAPAKTATRRQPLFVDPWDHPILYYKASPASRRMIASEDQPGIYRQEDNAIITGCKNGIDEYAGIDFGAGETDGVYHRIALADAPDPTDDLTQPKFDNSFARFIWDQGVKARNTPVRKDAYLLISAGPDGIYGSDDDIVNWTRNLD
ncbi:MAG: hypothetical protein KJ749_06935, partial [Planctomycetes bacterium]|nr:hypothetical protein [Planctomycetota bacterium]